MAAQTTESTLRCIKPVDCLTLRLMDSIIDGKDVGTVQALVQEGADINAALDPDGDTPLLLACLNNREKIVDLLIKSGANVDGCCTNSGTTVLHYATKNGWTEIVRILVKKVRDLDVRNFRDETALHIASTEGLLDIVRCLVEEGADINLKNYNDFTPLLCAAARSHKDVVDFLLNSMANVKGDEEILMFCASDKGWLDIIVFFLKRVPDLSKKYMRRFNPLHAAAYRGYLEIVQCLVEGGFDINSRDSDGETVLHTASHVGHLEIVKWLLKKVPHVVTVFHPNMKNDKGETALHKALERGHLDIVKCLLKGGADVNIKNGNSVTPLMLALKRKLENVVDFMRTLVEGGCDMDAKDKYGMAALHYACMDSLDATQYLLQAGANWDITDDDGDSPLDYVTKEEWPMFFRLFIENGAYINLRDYDSFVGNSLLEVLRDVKLCCRAIVNKFNNHDLPELYKLPVSGSLPPIEQIKITSDSEVARGIERTVEFEIQTKGHCSILAVRPMALRMYSVRSALEYHEKKKFEKQNPFKQSSNDKHPHLNKEIRISFKTMRAFW